MPQYTLHEIVILSADYTDAKRIIQKGSLATIVYRYPSGVHFEVEVKNALGLGDTILVHQSKIEKRMTVESNGR